VNEVIYQSSGSGRMGPPSTFDVDSTRSHSFPGPVGEVKEHLPCSCRRVSVCTARQQSLFHSSTRDGLLLAATGDITIEQRAPRQPSVGSIRRTQTGTHSEHQWPLSLLPPHITTPYNHSIQPLHTTTPYNHSIQPLHTTTPYNHNNNNIKMWQQIKDLFRLCFGKRDTIEQPARPRNPTRPAARRSSFD
jgi:hypothetical protein